MGPYDQSPCTRASSPQLRSRDPGARRVGSKIAGGLAEMEELIGTEPVIGNLTSATRLEPGATYRADGPLHADAEIVIEVDPRGDAAGLGVGLELVDLRRPAGGAEAIRGPRAGWARDRSVNVNCG